MILKRVWLSRIDLREQAIGLTNISRTKNYEARTHSGAGHPTTLTYGDFPIGARIYVDHVVLMSSESGLWTLDFVISPESVYIPCGGGKT